MIRVMVYLGVWGVFFKADRYTSPLSAIMESIFLGFTQKCEAQCCYEVSYMGKWGVFFYFHAVLPSFTSCGQYNSYRNFVAWSSAANPER